MCRKFIITAIFFLILPLCFAADNYFEVSIGYHYGNLSKNYVVVRPLITQTFFPEAGEYKAEILDYENNRLYITDFDIITSIGMSVYNFTETFERFVFDFELNLPYFPDAKILNIYDNNNTKLLSIDLSPYSAREYFVEEEEIIMPEVAPEEIEELPVEKPLKEEKRVVNYLIILVIVIAALILIVIVFKKRKREKPETELV